MIFFLEWVVVALIGIAGWLAVFCYLQHKKLRAYQDFIRARILVAIKDSADEKGRHLYLIKPDKQSFQ